MKDKTREKQTDTKQKKKQITHTHTHIHTYIQQRHVYIHPPTHTHTHTHTHTQITNTNPHIKQKIYHKLQQKRGRRVGVRGVRGRYSYLKFDEKLHHFQIFVINCHKESRAAERIHTVKVDGACLCGPDEDSVQVRRTGEVSN